MKETITVSRNKTGTKGRCQSRKKKSTIIIVLFLRGRGGVRGHYRTFYFNSKMAQFVQKCKEKIFPLVRGGGGKRGLTKGLTRGLRRSLVKIF